MPTYEFECKSCGHRFSVSESLREHDEHHEKCPSCGGRDIQQVPSLVNVKTSRKS